MPWEGETQQAGIPRGQQSGSGSQKHGVNPKENLMTLHQSCECSWHPVVNGGAQPCHIAPWGL